MALVILLQFCNVRNKLIFDVRRIIRVNNKIF